MSIIDNILDRIRPKTLVKVENDQNNEVNIDLEPDGSLHSTALAESSAFNFDVISTSEADLIQQYRKISHIPEVSTAIDEIINEIVVIEDEKNVVDLIIKNEKSFKKNIRDSVHESFKYVTEELLDFNNTAYDKSKDWYVDSRLVFLKNLNNDGTRIASLTQLDPVKVRRIKIIEENDDNLVKVIDDYYVYLRSEDKRNSKNDVFDGAASTSIQMTMNAYQQYKADVVFKIPKQLIVFVDSGLLNRSSNIIYGHLHKAVKASNQLELVESSSVIHRLSRSTPQRVIYVDTGNLNESKAKQSLEAVKRAMRNSIGYDSTRGTITTKNRVMSLREDIFMSRHSGSSATEIRDVGPDGGFDNMDGVTYFKEKLYSSLNIPISRFKDSTSIFAQNSEITREELKFNRFIMRLRSKFSKLFFDLLKTDLLLRKIISESEWADIYKNLSVRYNNDNHFSQLKDLEILGTRIEAINAVQDIVGKYISNDYVRRNILMQSDEEIETQDNLIKQEAADEDKSSDE